MMMRSRLELKVVPGASRTEVVGWLGQSLKVKVAAPPEKGKANKAVVKLLSQMLGVSENAIVLVSGATSQRKVVEIEGIDQAHLNGLMRSCIST